MNHSMGLYKQPFESIRSGEKTIEVRLWDEKRRKVRPGDTITFTLIPDADPQLIVKVIDLTVYPTFRKMYETIPAHLIGASGVSIDEMIDNTYRIYTPEQEEKWGTVAIKIEVISN